MKRLLLIFALLFLTALPALAQCSMCAASASQSGKDQVRALRNGILILGAPPFAMMLGVVGLVRWYHRKDNSGR